jgi:hypothetical protein
VPVGCGDAPVFPGDVVVGDNDGVLILPAHLADELAAEATEMTAYEDFVDRGGPQGPLHPRPVPGDRRAQPRGLRRVAEGEGR